MSEEPQRFDRIEANSIVVKGGRGIDLTISGTADGVGMWLANDKHDGCQIAVFNMHDQLAIGLYGPNKSEGMAIAIVVDAKSGKPYLQVVEPGEEPQFLDADDIKKLLKRAEE